MTVVPAAPVHSNEQVLTVNLTDYTAIIPSASRPHLLALSLRSMFAMLCPTPSRLLIHDDAAFPGQRSMIEAAINDCVPKHVDVICQYDDPPIFHGPALYWLLKRLPPGDEFCFYTQDDWEFLRPVPVFDAFALLRRFRLNHIRFNKRETMPYKGEGPTRWEKTEYLCPDDLDVLTGIPREVATGAFPRGGQILTLSDHWYFQASVWRVAHIKPVVDWWFENHLGSFRDAAEIKINHTFNGQVRLARDLPILLPPIGAPANHHVTRSLVQSTWIWGPIGEQPYIRHLGVAEKDFARKGDRPG